jgi:hypothetical protein
MELNIQYPGLQELLNFNKPPGSNEYQHTTKKGLDAYNSLLNLTYEVDNINKEKELILKEGGVKDWNNLPDNLKNEYQLLLDREKLIGNTSERWDVDAESNALLTIFNQELSLGKQKIAEGQTVSRRSNL